MGNGNKVAASVTVYGVGEMTVEGRREVAKWLRELAGEMQREPETFAKTFRARYMYAANSGALRRRNDVGTSPLLGRDGG